MRVGAAWKQQRMGSKEIGLILVGLALLTGAFGCATMEGGDKADKIAKETEAPPKIAPPVTSYTRPEGAQPFVVPYYPPPEKMDLCGEPVPLQLQEVAERFDREFTVIVYNHAQVYLWLKRMERFFPWMDERLRHYNLPEDLKYVAIVESDLLPNACSPKGAAGPWQFMPKTGCSYGLDQRGSYDERFDFELATDCAFRYLSDLYKRYRNWALAIACYNCGDKRIVEQMKAQRTNDYYHMKLPQETERYVFRILAIKAVLGNPSQYGYNLPRGQGYAELKTDRVTISTSRTVTLQNIADAAGTTFREIKRLNPTFRGDDLPPGTYEVKVPKGTAKDFEKHFETVKARVKSDEPKPAEEKERASYEQEAPPAKVQVAKAAEPEVKPAERKAAVEAKAAERSAAVAAKPAEKPAPSSESKTSAGKPVLPGKAQNDKGSASDTRRSPETAAETLHTVKKGETLSAIAGQYKVSVSEIRKLNKLKNDDLAPGQRIRIK